MEHDALNHHLDLAAFKLVSWLERQGSISVPVSATGVDIHKNLAGDISCKHIAVQAGLGAFGLNNLVLTPQFGPRVRWVAIVTEAEVEPDQPLAGEIRQRLADFCRQCRRCVESCPAGALENAAADFSPLTGWGIAKARCYHYMHVVSGGKRCRTCVAVCPAYLSQ